jgi:hypothetical protein
VTTKRQKTASVKKPRSDNQAAEDRFGKNRLAVTTKRQKTASVKKTSQ